MYYEELCFHLCVQILRSSRARLPGARWPSMYCCSRLRLNERLHTHCSMFSVRCSVYIVHVLSILATLRAHCLMFNVCCLMFALGSSMRDCGWIVHKRSILHALMPSFPQSHHWIHAKQKIFMSENRRRCWLADRLEDRRGSCLASAVSQFIPHSSSSVVRILIGVRPYYGALSFCPGRQQSRTRSVAWLENPDFYAEADT